MKKQILIACVAFCIFACVIFTENIVFSPFAQASGSIGSLFPQSSPMPENVQSLFPSFTHASETPEPSETKVFANAEQETLDLLQAVTDALGEESLIWEEGDGYIRLSWNSSIFTFATASRFLEIAAQCDQYEHIIVQFDFTIHTCTIRFADTVSPLPDVAVSSECSICNGAVICQACDPASCRRCNGTQYMQCPVCMGDGECSFCQGQKVGASGWPCRYCGGSGACRECNGSKQVPCIFCACTHCGGSRICPYYY